MENAKCNMERRRFNLNREASNPDECKGRKKVNYTCESCQLDGRCLTAAGYCVNCDEYMCDECYKCHRRPKILKNHVLLDSSEMPKERQPIDTNDICFDLCTSHEKKVIEYYCKDCNVIGCNACMTIEHKSCVNVQFIPKLVKKSGFERKYSLSQTVIGNAIKSCEMGKEQIKCYQQAVAINSTESKRHLTVAIDEFYREGVTRIDQHEKMNINKLNSKLTQLDKILDDLEGIKSGLDDKKQTKKLCPLFCALKDAEVALENYEKLIDTIKDEMSVTKITFKSSSRIRNDIQDSKLFDKVFTLENRKKSQKYSTEKAEYKRSIDVVKENRHLKDISGCCFLSGGFLALVDRNNNKMKVIKLDEPNVQQSEKSAKIKIEDSGLNSQHMTFETELSSEPFGITALPEVIDDQTSVRQIAVTMPKENKFIVIQVKHNKLQQSHEVPTNGACYGIGLLGNTIIITFESPPRIEYTTLAGERTACIENQSCGKQLFEKPRYIAVDKEREQIYISDTSSHTITALNKDGIIVGYFQEPRIITEPKGIVVDKNGSLLVCVWWPYSIQRISSDLLEVETLAFKSNVWGPVAIAYCATENRFYVAIENSSGILEYQLSD